MTTIRLLLAKAKVRAVRLSLMVSFLFSFANPAQANTAVVSHSSSQPSVLVSKNQNEVDQIIDKYVQKYMWDAETYDSTDSLYRELYHDTTTKQYPSLIRSIAAESGILDSTGSAALEDGVVDTTSVRASPWSKLKNLDMGRALERATSLLQRKTGWKRSTAMALIAGALVMSAPTIILGGGLIFGGISKRNMNKIFKQRYGSTYSVDATAKDEESVEAPEDEDDEEEEEEEEDDGNDEEDGSDE
jgi:hypothetical protein